jgi:hypothetical protein
MTIETNARPSVHDQVLVEAEIGDRVAGFRAVVINVMPDCLWLGLLKPDPLLERIRPNDPVVLTFRCNRAAMVASETFLSHLGTGQSRFFSVRWSEGVELVQRRAYLRMNAECPVDFTVISSDNAEPGQTLSGVTRNLSAAGLLFGVGVPMASTVAVGDLVEVKISLGNGLVFADARVVRVEDATDIGPDGKPVPPARATHRPMTHVAVQFEHIPEGAQDRIVRYIFFLQRARRDTRPGRLRSSYSSGARW